jgi:hypothetical protein
MHLRHLITHRRVNWYPDCGGVFPTNSPRDDLETELASLLLKQSESGRLRIDHRRDGVHHNDRAFTLGAACLHLSEDRDGGPDPFALTPPIHGQFAW